MKVSLLANKCDQATRKIADALYRPFKELGAELSGDYDGTMEHLWIDFELIRSHCEMRPSWPFRFQKKVGGGTCRLTGLTTPVSENVGHYSVRPDFDVLLGLHLESVATYALSRIYESTSVLIEKRRKLGGFDADRFRANFLTSCRKIGHPLDTEQSNANKSWDATGDKPSI